MYIKINFITINGNKKKKIINNPSSIDLDESFLTEKKVDSKYYINIELEDKRYIKYDSEDFEKINITVINKETNNILDVYNINKGKLEIWF